MRQIYDYISDLWFNNHQTKEIFLKSCGLLFLILVGLGTLGTG